jgi:spore maturation protein CgeB
MKNDDERIKTMKILKNWLKKNKFIFNINAKVKSVIDKNRYNNLVKFYKNLPIISKKIKIKSQLNHIFFYLGTDELQDFGGIIQGLQTHGKVFYFTKKNGEYGQYVNFSEEERKQKNSNRLLEIFNELKKTSQVPSILFSQTFNTYIDASVFKIIKKEYNTLIINIGMDDRHQFKDNIYPMLKYIDLGLSAAPECVEWYLKEGCPAIFFPEASDENIYHPMPNLLKKHDVSFVGAKYGIREKIVLALRDEGIQVTAYGSGWGTGFLPVSEVPKLFAESKIVLGVGTIGHSHDFYALKMRDFDGPMSGSCYLTHDNSDLYSLFEIGKEIVTYKDIAECVEKVKYLLKNESEREAIARAGYIRAKAEHTWTIRFKNVLDIIFEK